MIDFAAAALPQETTGLSPFRIEFGYEPRTSFDWEHRAQETYKDVSKGQAHEMAREM